MPYASNRALPKSVRHHLPPHAQEIFRKAFNDAWSRYVKTGMRREEVAHRVAWSAVKKTYEKFGEDWVPKHRSNLV